MDAAVNWYFNNPGKADEASSEEEMYLFCFGVLNIQETICYRPSRPRRIQTRHLCQTRPRNERRKNSCAMFPRYSRYVSPLFILAEILKGLYKKMIVGNASILTNWEQSGQKKVVLSIENGEALYDLPSSRLANNRRTELETKARAKGLPCQVIRDAGRTEVEAGTMTVLAIAGANSQVNEVTGHLKTLK
jgi:peptidyl-tRNA hydrolase